MEEEKKSLVVLVPCYKSIPTVTFRSMVTLFTNIEKYFKMNYVIQDGLYIPVGRNRLVETLASGGDLAENDYILWLDSDQIFSMEDILTLIHHYKSNDYDLLSGQINIRTPVPNGKVMPMAYFIDQAGHPQMVPLEKGDFTKIDACGMGCLLMSGKVLKKIMDDLEPNEKLFRADYTKGGMFVGEDIYFFKRVKKLGLKVAIDNHVHVAHYGFSR